MEAGVKNHAKEELFYATGEEVREKLQTLEELAVSYNQKSQEAATRSREALGLEDELYKL